MHARYEFPLFEIVGAQSVVSGMKGGAHAGDIDLLAACLGDALGGDPLVEIKEPTYVAAASGNMCRVLTHRHTHSYRVGETDHL